MLTCMVTRLTTPEIFDNKPVGSIICLLRAGPCQHMLYDEMTHFTVMHEISRRIQDSTHFDRCQNRI